MRLDTTPDGGGPIVRAVGPAGFLIGESRYRAVLMSVSQVAEWSPPPLGNLDEDALAVILEPAPEFILLGTGATLARPPRTLISTLEARGIGVEPMDSRAAARAWAVLRAEARPIAAALYPVG